jgi:hypothetical protein
VTRTFVVTDEVLGVVECDLQNPKHKLRPRIISACYTTRGFIVAEELTFDGREVNLRGLFRSAIRDDLVPVGSTGCKGAVIDDQVFLGPGDQRDEALQKFVLRKNKVGCSVAPF